MKKEFSKRVRSNFEQFFREKHPEWELATGSKNTFPGWRLYERRLSENSPDTKAYILLMVDAQHDRFVIDIAINDTGDISPWQPFPPISEATTNNRFPLALLWGGRVGFDWRLSDSGPLLSIQSAANISEELLEFKKREIEEFRKSSNLLLDTYCTDAFEKIEAYALPFFERVAHKAQNP
jgi:hypothetical protein